MVVNGLSLSQLVRSPGVYFNDKVDKNGKVGYGSTVIPNRGAWLELETDSKDIAYTVSTALVRFHLQPWCVLLVSQVMMKSLISLGTANGSQYH